MKPSKTLRGRIVLFVLSSVVSVAVLIGLYELVETTRYHHWRKHFDNYGWFGKITVASGNPDLMWEYRPYGEVQKIKTNRYGFRERDFETMARPADVFRVAIAGDSVTLGVGVDIEDTLVKQIEVIAKDADLERRLQTLNFGIDGYHTIQVTSLIRTRVLKWSPDVVVYVLCLNDFDFATSSGVKIRYFRKPPSFFLAKLDRAWENLSGAEFHRYRFGRNKQAVFASILDMQKAVAQAGAKLVVAIVPVFLRKEQDWRSYHLRDLHGEIQGTLAAEGVVVVDLLPRFEGEAQPPSQVSQDIWHPNATGNRIIAQGLAAAIMEHL